MIVVYYGVNLSLSLPFCLSFSLLFPFLVLCLCPNPHFHFLHRSSINLFQPLPIPSAYSSGLATTQSCPLPCFSRFLYALCLCTDLHPFRCLSLSFCILNWPYSASFPFLALQLISSRPLLYLIFHFLPVFQSRRVPPALALPLLFFFPSSSSSGLFRPLNLARPSPSPSPSPLGYTSLLQMSRPLQI